MKAKILTLMLIITSLIGYLEWGKGSNLFLFQAEAEIFSKLFSDPRSVLHPFTLLPLAGQLILLITLFQKHPVRWMTIAGIAGIGLLFLFMFIIGIISLNYRILLSTLPFLTTAILVIRISQTKRPS